MAAYTHYVQEDLNLIPLLNFVAEPIAGNATPGAANVGKVYRNTASGRLEYVLNATTVVSLPYAGAIADADISGTAAIAMTKLATNPLPRANHTGTQLAATVSDFLATVWAQRLDQLAAPTAALNLGSQKITVMADGVANTDATTVQQVTNLLSAAINGHDWKDAVRVASAVNVTVASPGASIDGVALSAADRVLLGGQTTASENGLYVWTGAATPMTRSTDANLSSMVSSGLTVAIEQGTKAASMAILTTPDPITLGTTALAFTFIANATAYTAGTGITLVGSVFSLTSPVAVALGGTGGTTAAAARTALQVGQKGFALDVPAITAGGSIAIVHSLGTLDVNVDVYRKSDGASVLIGRVRTDANTVTLSADVAVSAAALRVVVNPIT